MVDPDHAGQNEDAVNIQELAKTVAGADGSVTILDRVNLRVKRGEFLAVLGVSGSGKTTLLNLMGAMDAPTSGRIAVFGHELSTLTERERTLFRRNHLGFVFQFYNLLPSLTAAENVKLGLELLGLPREEMDRRAAHYLAEVGLAGKEDRFPAQLSGGEQQRVTIARALAKHPLLVLADEPTGNLDRATGRAVLTLMRKLNTESGVTFVIVTHDEEVGSICDSVFRLT